MDLWCGLLFLSAVIALVTVAVSPVGICVSPTPPPTVFLGSGHLRQLLEAHSFPLVTDSGSRTHVVCETDF
ncbi:hypothetical protein C8F01DRAFT_1150042 [Mycena amicta]|nr:hypothetical protein C8F01DRAFT_1150042 [Mycena amicta]